MIFSYSLVLALFLLAPGLGVYAGLFSGASRGAFRPGAPAPASVLTLGIIVLGALFAHTVWALACAANDAWADAGLPTALPALPNAYTVLVGAVIDHRGAGDRGIAVFLVTSSLLSVAAFVATTWVVGMRALRPLYLRLIYGWLSDLVAAAADDGAFILAFVVTDIQAGDHSLGYQGGVLNMTVNDNKQITAIVLEDASAFLLKMDGESVEHVPVPRASPIAQLYLDAPRIRNIAFKVFAFED